MQHARRSSLSHPNAACALCLSGAASLARADSAFARMNTAEAASEEPGAAAGPGQLCSLIFVPLPALCMPKIGSTCGAAACSPAVHAWLKACY
jgi:hypothetical protein